MNDLKRAMETDDTAVIKRMTETLTAVTHKLSASMYQGTSPGDSPGSNFRKSDRHPTGRGVDDDIVDADFQEVA